MGFTKDRAVPRSHDGNVRSRRGRQTGGAVRLGRRGRAQMMALRCVAEPNGKSKCAVSLPTDTARYTGPVAMPSAAGAGVHRPRRRGHGRLRGEQRGGTCVGVSVHFAVPAGPLPSMLTVAAASPKTDNNANTQKDGGGRTRERERERARREPDLEIGEWLCVDIEGYF